MGLAELWSTSREQLIDKRVQQIIAFAGDGLLADGGTAAHEFRQFLALIPSSFLERYADECLRESFVSSGFALQDIVNQITNLYGKLVLAICPRTVILLSYALSPKRMMFWGILLSGSAFILIRRTFLPVRSKACLCWGVAPPRLY
jgi:hypothetical protein